MRPAPTRSAPVINQGYGGGGGYLPGSSQSLPPPSTNRTSNPFDDDAGFFANMPTSATNKSKPTTNNFSGGGDPAPPTYEQQRLLRVASMLFERGLLIRGDKIQLQDIVLSSSPSSAEADKVKSALDVAERDGNIKLIEDLLLEQRGG